MALGPACSGQCSQGLAPCDRGLNPSLTLQSWTPSQPSTWPSTQQPALSTLDLRVGLSDPGNVTLKVCVRGH